MLVSARKFPGIDATKLDAVHEPATIEKSPRRLTAPEMLDVSLADDDRTAGSEDGSAATADLGELRDRITPRN